PLMKRRLGSPPLPRRLRRVAGACLTMAVPARHLLVGLLRRCPGPLRKGLRLAQGAAPFVGRVKVIQLLRDGLLPVLLPLFVAPGHAALQPRAAVAGQVLEVGERLQLFGPGFAVAAGGKLPRQPALALGLNDHEDRLLSEEYLVIRTLTHAG